MVWRILFPLKNDKSKIGVWKWENIDLRGLQNALGVVLYVRVSCRNYGRFRLHADL